MADKAVRQAVVLAIDRSAYVSKVLAGVGGPGRLIIPATVLGPHAGSVAVPTFDSASAGRLLDAAGWRPGTDG